MKSDDQTSIEKFWLAEYYIILYKLYQINLHKNHHRKFMMIRQLFYDRNLCKSVKNRLWRTYFMVPVIELLHFPQPSNNSSYCMNLPIYHGSVKATLLSSWFRYSMHQQKVRFFLVLAFLKANECSYFLLKVQVKITRIIISKTRSQTITC